MRPPQPRDDLRGVIADREMAVPAFMASPLRASMLAADAKALSVCEHATAVALRRLQERATKIEEARQQAYYAGKVDAESRLFWFGVLFGGLIGAAVTFVHLMSGGAA